MARMKKADSAINSFFTDTSKEMIDRQETIVEKVVNPAPEPEAGGAKAEGPSHRLSVIVPDDLYWQLKKYLVEHRGEGYRCSRTICARTARRAVRYRIEGKTEMTAFEYSAQGYRVAPYIADLGKKAA